MIKPELWEYVLAKKILCLNKMFTMSPLFKKKVYFKQQFMKNIFRIKNIFITYIILKMNLELCSIILYTNAIYYQNCYHRYLMFLNFFSDVYTFAI